MLHIGATLLLAVTSSAACQSDLDCSLNGICSTNQTCTCDAPWGGAACELLIRGPTRVTGGGIYGYAPNVTSWGGNVIRGDDGTWNMWVSEMIGGCSPSLSMCCEHRLSLTTSQKPLVDGDR